MKNIEVGSGEQRAVVDEEYKIGVCPDTTKSLRTAVP